MDNIIKITSDARFRLARSLMTSGNDGGATNSSSDDTLEGAIDIFASLLEETRNTCGETSLNAALCYYEYGNALFRAVVRRKPLDGGDGTQQHDEEDRKPAAKKPSDSAGRKRSLDDDTNEPDLDVSNKKAKIENNDEQDDNEEDDIALALEMLSTSFSIFDWHSTDDDENTKTKPEGKQYSLTQIPRVLTTIGDIHSHCGKFGDAVDAYCRALSYREKAWEERQLAKKAKGESLSVEDLKCQRLIVETYALITEALLACKDGEDVVCANDEENEGDSNVATAKKGGDKEGKVLVAANDRIDFAESHYETAREKLQDIGMCMCAVMIATTCPSFCY